MLDITGLQIIERELQGLSPSPSKNDLSSLVAHFEFSLFIWQTYLRIFSPTVLIIMGSNHITFLSFFSIRIYRRRWNFLTFDNLSDKLSDFVTSRLSITVLLETAK